LEFRMKKKTHAEWLAGAGVPIDACLERIAARVVEWAKANRKPGCPRHLVRIIAAQELEKLTEELREGEGDE
jgi:hypothetical protein